MVPFLFRRFISHLPRSIVEFASQEDAQRSVRELSEQILLSRPVFIREVSAPSCVFVISLSTDRYLRTERTSHVSAPPPFLEKLAWLWPAVGCMLLLPLGLPITITLVNQGATLVTNYTLATYVVDTYSRCNFGRYLFCR